MIIKPGLTFATKGLLWPLVYLLAACSQPPLEQTAHKIFSGGTIITMNDEQPTVEAVAIKDGKILALGSLEDINQQYKGQQTQSHDLAGATLMPGFFDSHSHLASVGMKQAMVNLDSPPAGSVTSIKDIQELLKQKLENQPPSEGQWLLGMGYDHAMLSDKRHPTKMDLDKISKDVPIALLHFSLHMAVLNSKALELEGINAHSKDPAGGHIHRLTNSQQPSGLLEETAMRKPLLRIIASLGDGSDLFNGQTFMEKGLQIYAKNGFTTVIEGAALPIQTKAYQYLASQGRLKQDVIALEFFETTSLKTVQKNYSPTYKNHFRVGGGKVVLDGGSPGRTAYLKQPYHKTLANQAPDYRGYPTIKKQQTLDDLVGAYYQAEVPVFIHALGDAAVEMCIDAVTTAESKLTGKQDKRTQLIHLQQVDDGQFERLKNLDVSLTFQMAHNFYFADFHASEIYGPKRTSLLNPIGSALKHNMSVTMHHDAPVHPVDQFTLIWAAVNRSSRSGKIWGAQQRISVMDALKASTINAAYQFHEDKSKGSIEKGKLADLIIIDQNPLTIAPSQLNTIKVLATFKEGENIFRAKHFVRH